MASVCRKYIKKKIVLKNRVVMCIMDTVHTCGTGHRVSLEYYPLAGVCARRMGSTSPSSFAARCVLAGEAWREVRLQAARPILRSEGLRRRASAMRNMRHVQIVVVVVLPAVGIAHTERVVISLIRLPAALLVRREVAIVMQIALRRRSRNEKGCARKELRVKQIDGAGDAVVGRDDGGVCRIAGDIPEIAALIVAVTVTVIIAECRPQIICVARLRPSARGMAAATPTAAIPPLSPTSPPRSRRARGSACGQTSPPRGTQSGGGSCGDPRPSRHC